jgi:chromate transport protein ChrA
MSKFNSASIQLSKEFVMARFAQVPFGLADSNRTAAGTVPAANQTSSEDSKTLAGMLLAAAMAALLVVADQVISTWSDGHLLAGWVALWTVAFAALAFLASPLRRVSSIGAAAFVQWRVQARMRRDDEKMWEFARHDPRVMAEIRMAQSRTIAES